MRKIELQLPLATVRSGTDEHGRPLEYLPEHVEIRMHTPAQQRALKRLHGGLCAANLSLENGRRVVSLADAVRYLLEQLERAAANGKA